jgi:transposase
MKNKKITATHRNKKENNRYKVTVSLDAHQHSIYIYAVNTRTGEILADKNIIGGFKAVLKQIKEFGLPKHIMIIFEAGQFGFSPYRLFKKAGYGCKIIAPSSIPNKSKKRKTDRDDSINNLDYHMSGILRYVYVPTANDEDAREFLRYRYEQVWKLTKQKQRINALIKRHGKVFDLTKTTWTRTHYNWLKSVDLLPCARKILDLMLNRLEEAYSDLERLDIMLDNIINENQRYKYLKALYEEIPGVGRVVSLTLLFEGQDFGRFANPSCLMNYTGLIPGKKASGDKDPAMRITKAGNKYLRLALVCTSKFYRDRRLLKSRDRISKLPAPLKSFIDRCQSRLNGRYLYLRGKGKNSNKVKVAIARELCGFVWELNVKVMPLLGDYKDLSKAA